MRRRDRQKARVYRAEVKVWGRNAPDLAEREVHDIVEQLRGGLGLPYVDVRFDLSNVTEPLGGVSDGQPFISLPVGRRSVDVVLHELAHAWVETEAPRRLAWHGPEWVRVYLLLVDRHLGEGAYRRLLWGFDRCGVDAERGVA